MPEGTKDDILLEYRTVLELFLLSNPGEPMRFSAESAAIATNALALILWIVDAHPNVYNTAAISWQTYLNSALHAAMH